MHSILEKIGELTANLPDNYSEKEKQAYLSACMAIRNIVLDTIDPVAIQRDFVQRVRIRVDIDGRMAHRRKSDQRHPIRLQISHNSEVKRYAISKFKTYLATDPQALYFHKNEWKDLWTKRDNPIKEDLLTLERKMAELIENNIRPFSFPKFEEFIATTDKST